MLPFWGGRETSEKEEIEEEKRKSERKNAEM